MLGQNGVLHPHSANETDLGLGVTIPFPTRLYLKGKVASADVQTAEYAFTLLQQQIGSQAAQTYDSLLVGMRRRADLQETRQLTQGFLKKTEARFNAGTAARIDVIKAKVDLAQVENSLIANERSIVNASAGLNRLLGRYLSAPVQATDTLAIPDTLPAFDGLEREALANRPELLGLAAQRAGAKANTALANQFWLPDINVALSRNNVYGEPTTWSTGIGIGVPIFFWQHRGGEVAESHSHEQELAAQYRNVSAQVGQDLRIAYSNAGTSLRQAIYLRDEVVPEAREAYRIASVSYGLGGASALDVLDARRTLVDAQSQYAEALAASNDALFELERAAAGPLFPNTAGEKNEKH